MIPFNKVFITGKELVNLKMVTEHGNWSGNGVFTHKCQNWFEKRYGFAKTFLTNSCTDALEMCALIMDIVPGDEIILPSYTFVSTANAFCNYGARPIFIDSLNSHPNIDPDKIEALITQKTKAIVVMHYAGFGCEMDKITQLAKKHNLFLIEDAALGLDAKYNNQWLGTFGDFSTFSFHQTKNISCGEGGLLAINNSKWIKKAETIWEKGTNRAEFLQGNANKYEWVSKGSSFLTSEFHAAILSAQLELFDKIQENRKRIWEFYYNELAEFKSIIIPDKSKCLHNASLFFFLFKDANLRVKYIEHMLKNEITVSSHYRCLHTSEYFMNLYGQIVLENSENIANSLIRLPLYTSLEEREFNKIIICTKDFLLSQ